MVWAYDVGDEVSVRDGYGLPSERAQLWRITGLDATIEADQPVPSYRLTSLSGVAFTGFTESALELRTTIDARLPEIQPVDSTDLPEPYGLQETIVTDPVTGGQKGKKPLQVGAIDPLARAELGKVAAFGGDKYDRGNYLKGYDWSLSVDALHRHLLAFESGEDYDDESGLLHAAHAAWHALALVSFTLRDLGTDDRFV
jgi:hypothetical protein